MKAIFFLTILAALSGRLPAQAVHEVVLPDGLAKIAETEVVNAAAKVEVVRGGKATVKGDGNWLLVRAGGSAEVSGTANEIFLEAGASVDLPGTGNTVYRVQPSRVNRHFGADNTLIPVGGFR